MNTYESMNTLRNGIKNLPYTYSNEFDGLIRGEISAVEAYEQVIKLPISSDYFYRLENIMDEHKLAVKFWQEESRRQGEVPENESSLWGTAVEAFVGVAKLVNTETAINALLTGEKYGLDNYKRLLDSSTLNIDHKKQIKNKFIPIQKSHIATLEDFVNYLKDKKAS